MSLRSRLIVGMAVVALVLLASMVVITRTTEAYLVDRVDAQLQGSDLQGRGFNVRDRNRLGHPDGPGGPVNPSVVPPSTGADDHSGNLSSFYVGEISTTGGLTTLATPAGTGSNLKPPDVSHLVTAATTSSSAVRPVTVPTKPASNLRYRAVVVPDDRGGTPLLLALPLTDVDAAVSRLVTVEVVVSTLILAILALVAFWVIRLGVRPIKAMTETATAIAGGDLSHRVPEGTQRTEAGALGTALNRMLTSIESAFAQQSRSEAKLRQFVADASHELRTPVTTIRGYAELYRAGALDDRDELNNAMRRTEQEALRMGELIEDLLLLARLDQGRPLERHRIDLGVLAVDAASDARAVDPRRPISASVTEDVTVLGDDRRLRQVVGNLVGNALVHTPPGTAVAVRVSRQDETGRAVLDVSDDGPGMAADVADHAFERFYRADPARSRHHGGSGLGLAIVKATVAAHGGDVTLRSSPGQGTTVRIELPLAGPTEARPDNGGPPRQIHESGTRAGVSSPTAP